MPSNGVGFGNLALDAYVEPWTMMQAQPEQAIPPFDVEYSPELHAQEFNPGPAELFFDLDMNDVPNPRRQRRRYEPEERLLVAAKRGKVCIDCKMGKRRVRLTTQ